MNVDEVDIDELSDKLRRCIVAAVPGWMTRMSAAVLGSQSIALRADEIAHMADEARQFVDLRLSELFAADVDQQRTTPLSILRDSVRYPNALLATQGATAFAAAGGSHFSQSEDPFHLMPASLADFGDEVHQAGLLWGAGKRPFTWPVAATRRSNSHREADAPWAGLQLAIPAGV